MLASASSPKYPRTPYLPFSPSIDSDSRPLAAPSHFVGEPIVITEKLDGSCTLLHQGAVYARGVGAPTSAKWMAMVKKHHAWKVNEPDAFLYGEDVYGVHSIEYGPVPEDETFYAFALRDNQGLFSSFDSLVDYASQRSIPVVPVLWDGIFRSEAQLRGFVDEAHAGPSALGGEREGVVIRLARSFPASQFSRLSARASAPVTSRPTSTGPGIGDLAVSLDRADVWRLARRHPACRGTEGGRVPGSCRQATPHVPSPADAEPERSRPQRAPDPPLIQKARAVPGPLSPSVPRQAALADAIPPRTAPRRSAALDRARPRSTALRRRSAAAPLPRTGY